jgi:L-serine dehydratase
MRDKNGPSYDGTAARNRKNVMAASNALCCANMALSDFDAVIPLDEVIESAKRVAGQMPRELRCTALGGLSITPSSLALEQKLASKKTACIPRCVRRA